MSLARLRSVTARPRVTGPARKSVTHKTAARSRVVPALKAEPARAHRRAAAAVERAPYVMPPTRRQGSWRASPGRLEPPSNVPLETTPPSPSSVASPPPAAPPPVAVYGMPRSISEWMEYAKGVKAGRKQAAYDTGHAAGNVSAVKEIEERAAEERAAMAAEAAQAGGAETGAAESEGSMQSWALIGGVVFLAWLMLRD